MKDSKTNEWVEDSLMKEVFNVIPKPVNKPLTKTQDNLSMLKGLINQYEQEKYPATLYKTQTKQVNLNGKTLDVLYVKYNQDNDKTHNDQLNTTSQAAIKIRKLNLIASVLSAMELPSFFTDLDQNRKILLEKELMALAKKAQQEDKNKYPDEAVNTFIKEMKNIIKKYTGEDSDDIIRKIRNSERYFIAENNANRILVFEHQHNNSTYCQIDVPFHYQYEITDEIKQHFLAIHNVNKDARPTWFTALPNWEQDYLLKLVPKPSEKNPDWSKLKQSSAMQHIPGVKNARVNYLLEKNDNKIQTLSKNIKMSTMVPYEMKGHKSELKEQGDATVHQTLSALQQLATENFENKWGNIFSDDERKKLKPIILVQQLLSDTTFGADDNVLSRQQNQSIEDVRMKDEFNNVEIIGGNEPVNILRVLAYQNAERWDYAHKVLNYADRFQEAIKNKKNVPLTNEQKEAIELISHAIKELKKLQDPFMLKNYQLTLGLRNYEAFKTAYLAILVEAMGGAVSTNCKSGKDRTGLDELYRNAMLIYFKQYKVLPSFSDEGTKRKKFIDIYVQLFNTMKTQEAASANTPGSFGLKDDAKMLCADITKELGDAYQYSNHNARMNKPGIFMHDEACQREELIGKKKLLRKKVALAAKLTVPGMAVGIAYTVAKKIAPESTTKLTNTMVKELNKRFGELFPTNNPNNLKITKNISSRNPTNDDKPSDDDGDGRKGRSTSHR